MGSPSQSQQEPLSTTNTTTIPPQAEKMRAKFQCHTVTELYGNEQVRLNAVYGGETNSEDNQFSQATPNGQLDITISNPAARGFFEVGKDYYLDISKAK